MHLLVTVGVTVLLHHWGDKQKNPRFAEQTRPIPGALLLRKAAFVAGVCQCGGVLGRPRESLLPWHPASPRLRAECCCPGQDRTVSGLRRRSAGHDAACAAVGSGCLQRIPALLRRSECCGR